MVRAFSTAREIDLKRAVFRIAVFALVVIAFKVLVKLPDGQPDQIDFAGCNQLAETAGAAMALRQLGGDESQVMRQDMSDGARRVVSRAFAEPIAAGDGGKALAARNFADSIKHDCLRG